MKVLRIYDHLGELKKEFNVYVEGEDFKWQASYPEPVWLGTILLEDAGKEPEKPSEVVSELLQPEPEPSPEEVEAEKPLKADTRQEEQVIRAMEVKDEPKKVHRKRGRVQRIISPGHTKSIEVIRKDDSSGDTNQGD